MPDVLPSWIWHCQPEEFCLDEVHDAGEDSPKEVEASGEEHDEGPAAVDEDEHPIDAYQVIDAKFREKIATNWKYEEDYDTDIKVNLDAYNKFRLDDATAEGV